MTARLNVAVVSSNLASYSTRRLREAAATRGHRVRILHPLRFGLVIRAGRAELHYRGEPLPSFDAVIPRIGASVARAGIAVVRQFEAARVPVLNSSLAIARARDKLWTMQLLCEEAVPIPVTAHARGRECVHGVVREVGGAPLVVKALEGSQGAGVLLAETVASAETLVEALQQNGQRVLVQELVKESLGRDLRVLVCGERVVAAMRRHAKAGDFRANVHRGGRGEAVSLDAASTELALLAARRLGLRVAGVDLLEAEGGPKLLEVNASPGLEGIERASGVDVAGAFLTELERQVALARSEAT